MKALAILLVMATAACSGTFGGERRTLRTVNATMLAVSTASIIWDGCQTLSAAHEDWSGGRTETGHGHAIRGGLIMGTAPSEATVVGYFIGAAVVNAAVWYLMPERWRWVVPAGVTVAQADTINKNFKATSWCKL